MFLFQSFIFIHVVKYLLVYFGIWRFIASFTIILWLVSQILWLWKMLYLIVVHWSSQIIWISSFTFLGHDDLPVVLTHVAYLSVLMTTLFCHFLNSGSPCKFFYLRIENDYSVKVKDSWDVIQCCLINSYSCLGGLTSSIYKDFDYFHPEDAEGSFAESYQPFSSWHISVSQKT